MTHERSESNEERADRLFAEFMVRRDMGGAEGVEELCAAHPDLAPALRRLKADCDALASLCDELAADVPSVRVPSDAAHEQLPRSVRAVLDQLARSAPERRRYRMLGEVARGGMGVILRVWDEDLRRTLAMKVVLGAGGHVASGETPLVRPRTLGRFLTEAQVTGQLDHPGIVPVHELGLDAEGRVYFTMKLVKGRDLRQVLDLVRAEQDGWSSTRVLGVLLKVCDAMSFAHSRGIVHRDLKPANVMVGDYGEVYVMDWGVARVLRRDEVFDAVDAAERLDVDPVTREGTVVGTPAYMSPEQARGASGELDERSDVYSVGAMLYHLLTGQAPFMPAGASTSGQVVLERVLAGPPGPVEDLAPDAPGEVIAICVKAMAREPALRYATMAELADDLRAFLEQRVVRAYERGALAELKKWIARNKAVAASVAALILAAIGAAFVFTAQENRAQRRELVRTHLEAASLARRGGAWHEVLDSLARAKSGGAVDDVQLALDAIDAHLGLVQIRAASELVTELERRDDLGSRRGSLLARKAQTIPERVGAPDRARHLFEQSLALELDDADREFVNGVLATDSGTALVHFENALRRDAFHPGAFQRRLSLLLALGRFAEVDEQVRFARSSSCQDPSIDFAHVLARAGDGEFERARRAIDELVPSVGNDIRSDLAAFVDRLQLLAEFPVEGVLGGFEDWMPGILAVWRDPEEGRVPLLAPACYAVKQAYSDIVVICSPLPTLLSPFVMPSALAMDRQTCARVLDGAYERHREAGIALVRGVANVISPLSAGEQQADKLRRCVPMFEHGAKTQSLLFGAQRISRQFFLHSIHDLSRFARDPAAAELLLALGEGFEVDARAQRSEIVVLANAMYAIGNEWLPLRLTEDWLRLHPDDDNARIERARWWSVAGAPERELELVEEFVRRNPDHARAKEVREHLLSTWSASAERFHAREASGK
ncbi:MAG: protein kinase domain-containing protein [Planctomycetota bacterium]